MKTEPDYVPHRDWDGRWKLLNIDGHNVVMFPRSALAKALNRSLGTIRMWERNRVLCHPRIRDNRGHWLYTEGQILALITLAEEEGVIDPDYRRPFSERFIREAWAILHLRP